MHVLVIIVNIDNMHGEKLKIVLLILIFKFLDNQVEDKIFCNE